MEIVSGNLETYFSDHHMGSAVIIKQCGCHAQKDRPTANELGTVEKQLSHFYRMKQE